MADSQLELEAALSEFQRLDHFSLYLNVKKSQIMSNRVDMETVKEL